MSARKRRRYKSKNKTKKRPVLFKFLVTLFIIVSAVGFILFKSEFWDGKNRLSVVITGDGGDVRITTFDPRLKEITDIVIPGNTQVEVSRSLGRLPIKNVWAVAENEGLGGELLAETVTSYFKFPVYVWANWQAIGFSDTSPFSIGKAVFVPYKTNLKIGDRFRLALFSIGVTNSKRASINLDETGYITKTKLVDGEEGYIVTGSFPTELLAVFSDPEISEELVNVIIRNASGDQLVAQEFGEVLEVLGAKVVSIEKLEPETVNCNLVGSDAQIVKKVAIIFVVWPSA